MLFRGQNDVHAPRFAVPAGILFKVSGCSRRLLPLLARSFACLFDPSSRVPRGAHAVLCTIERDKSGALRQKTRVSSRVFKPSIQV